MICFIVLIFFFRIDVSNDIRLEYDSFGELYPFIKYSVELLAIFKNKRKLSLLKPIVQNIQHGFQLRFHFCIASVAR